MDVREFGPLGPWHNDSDGDGVRTGDFGGDGRPAVWVVFDHEDYRYRWYPNYLLPVGGGRGFVHRDEAAAAADAWLVSIGARFEPGAEPAASGTAPGASIVGTIDGTYDRDPTRHCHAKHPDGWTCNRTKGHAGDHVPHIGDKVCADPWPNDADEAVDFTRDTTGAVYRSHPSGVECLTIARHMTFNAGNVLKYLWRAGLKVPAGATPDAAALDDLRKARVYLDDEIERLTAAAGAKAGT